VEVEETVVRMCGNVLEIVRQGTVEEVNIESVSGCKLSLWFEVVSACDGEHARG